VTRDEMVARVKARLGKRTGTLLDDDIVAELQQMQLDLEQSAFLPWFLIRRAGWGTTVVASGQITLPTGYIRPYKFDDVFLQDPDTLDWFAVPRRRYKDLIQLSGATAAAQGKPQYWEYVGGVFYIRPRADKAYPVNSTYYEADSTLSLGVSTNSWSTYAPNLLIAGVQQVIAGSYLQNSKLEMSAEKEYVRQLQLLINSTTVREESPRDESKDDYLYYSADED